MPLWRPGGLANAPPMGPSDADHALPITHPCYTPTMRQRVSLSNPVRPSEITPFRAQPSALPWVRRDLDGRLTGSHTSAYYSSLVHAFTTQFEKNRKEDDREKREVRVEAHPNIAQRLVSPPPDRPGSSRTDIDVVGVQYFASKRCSIPFIPGAPGSTWYTAGKGLVQDFEYWSYGEDGGFRPSGYLPDSNVVPFLYKGYLCSNSTVEKFGLLTLH